MEGGEEVCRTIALQPLSEMSESSGNKLPGRLDRGVVELSNQKEVERPLASCTTVRDRYTQFSVQSAFFFYLHSQSHRNINQYPEVAMNLFLQTKDPNF